MRCAVVLLFVLALPVFAFAAAHGPVFGLATPTNSQGEWSFDEGIFGRNTALGSQASVRELIAYGFTPHLTLSLTNLKLHEIVRTDELKPLEDRTAVVEVWWLSPHPFRAADRFPLGNSANPPFGFRRSDPNRNRREFFGRCFSPL